MHMLSHKPDSFYHPEQKMALGYQNPFYLKQAQQKQQSLYNGKVLLEKHDPPAMYDSEETLELAQEKDFHKSIKDEILPIVNQVDARVQNFEIQVLKEAAKFVRDFKPLTKEADESLTKHKALELEIERLLRAVVSQDIMFIVQVILFVQDTTKGLILLKLLEDVNSITNGFSPKNVESTTRTRRPQPRNNPKSDKVPFKSKSSCLSNKLEKIKENHRSLQSSNYPDHTSSECDNIELTI
ncbi:hypothetical protein Tco_0045807 [Tanacetum coccineum]